MSAFPMSPERLASMRRTLEDWRADRISHVSIYAFEKCLDAIESANAEVQRLTEESRRPAAVPERAAWLTIEEMANALVLEFGMPIGAARGFARAIAEASKAKGARLPAAVQGVEVPELTYEAFAEIMDTTELIAGVRQRETARRERITQWFRSRLSPSPQPSADVVVVSVETAKIAEWAIDLIECADPEHYAAGRELHDALRSAQAQPTDSGEA